MSNHSASHDNSCHDFDVALINRQSRHAVDEQQLCAAVRAVLHGSDLATANISVAVVDDAAIHALNRQYLEHDWPTDVLSFLLEEGGGHVEGEVILSADTAATAAAESGWPAAAEQLLYVIHGTLHLVGYRDKTAADAQSMRAAEARYLLQFGFEPPRRDEAPPEPDPATGNSKRPGAAAR
jgi:probable rRNA maturation factor